MSINVTAANSQAAQLSSYANQLRQAKTQLSSYKSSVNQNWQAEEVTYIGKGIDKAISDIDAIIKELESIGTDIKNAAAAIRREEEAAERARREQEARERARREQEAREKADRERRIREAEAAYEQAKKELDALNRELSELIKTIAKAPISKKLSLSSQLTQLYSRVNAAQAKCNECKSQLDAARR